MSRVQLCFSYLSLCHLVWQEEREVGFQFILDFVIGDIKLIFTPPPLGEVNIWHLTSTMQAIEKHGGNPARYVITNYTLLISITVNDIASTISSSFKINLISQYFIRFYFRYFTRSGHLNLLKALRSSMEYESRNVSLKYCGKEVWRIFLDDKFLSPFN